MRNIYKPFIFRSIHMAESIYAIEVDKINKEEWYDILQTFSDASLYQTWAYGAVRWGEKNLSHAIVKCGNKIVAMAQLTIMKLPLLNIGIAYLSQGPVWHLRNNETSPEILHKTLQLIKKEYCEKRGLFLRILPNEEDDETKFFHKLYESEGFKLSDKKPYRTLIIDLSKSTEELRKGLDKKWRNRLTSSEKKGIRVVSGTSNDLFEKALATYHEMHQRKKFMAITDVDEFREIQKDLPDSLKMQIFIGIYGGALAYGCVYAAIGDGGLWLLGGTTKEGMEINVSYLVQWKVLEWLKQKGYCFADLGGINSELNPGVFHFKQDFAGKNGKEIYHIGEYEACNSALVSILLKFADSLRKGYRFITRAI